VPLEVLFDEVQLRVHVHGRDATPPA
jgi:hypothetical protein